MRKNTVKNKICSLRQYATTDPNGKGVRVSQTVLTALDEMLEELAKPRSDWERLEDLTGIKSYICGRLLPDYTFSEDREHNEEILGTNVYRELDFLHSKICFNHKSFPSGMLEVSRERMILGIKKRPNLKISVERSRLNPSPTLITMAEEHTRIVAGTDAK